MDLAQIGSPRALLCKYCQHTKGNRQHRKRNLFLDYLPPEQGLAKIKIDEYHTHTKRYGHAFDNRLNRNKIKASR